MVTLPRPVYPDGGVIAETEESLRLMVCRITHPSIVVVTCGEACVVPDRLVAPSKAALWIGVVWSTPDHAVRTADCLTGAPAVTDRSTVLSGSPPDAILQRAAVRDAPLRWGPPPPSSGTYAHPSGRSIGATSVATG